MELPTKMCPYCKKHVIKSFESVCWWCWQFIKFNDEHFGTNWRKHLITLNYVREECRKAGFDPFVRMPF